MSGIQFKCPVCKEAVARDNSHFPFCSQHCRNIDLNNWASESYSIPGEPAPLDDEDKTQYH